MKLKHFKLRLRPHLMYTKSSWNQLIGRSCSSYADEIYVLILFSYTVFTLLCANSFSCMPLQTRRINRFVCSMVQTTRFGLRMCLLRVALIRNYICRVSTKSILSKNFWTIGGRLKTPMVRLNKIGFGELNRGVSFIAACLPSADFECPPKRVSHKSLITS